MQGMVTDRAIDGRCIIKKLRQCLSMTRKKDGGHSPVGRWASVGFELQGRWNDALIVVVRFHTKQTGKLVENFLKTIPLNEMLRTAMKKVRERWTCR